MYNNNDVSGDFVWKWSYTNHNLISQILKKLWNIFCCSSIVDFLLCRTGRVLLDCEFDSLGFNKKFYDKINGTHQACCNIDLKK